MKTFKNINLAAIAALIIAGTAAFTTKPNRAKALADEVWFSYNSTSQATGDLQNQENYSFLSEDQPSCNSGSKRCAVQAQRSSLDPNQPDLSTMIAEVKKL